MWLTPRFFRLTLDLQTFPSRIQRGAAISDGQGRHMAQAREFPLRSHQAPRSRSKKYWKILIILITLSLAVSAIPSASGQTQQPFLIAVQTASNQHGTVTFLRDDTTGVLTAVPN